MNSRVVNIIILNNTDGKNKRRERENNNSTTCRSCLDSIVQAGRKTKKKRKSEKQKARKRKPKRQAVNKHIHRQREREREKQNVDECENDSNEENNGDNAVVFCAEERRRGEIQASWGQIYIRMVVIDASESSRWFSMIICPFLSLCLSFLPLVFSGRSSRTRRRRKKRVYSFLIRLYLLQ